MPNRTGRYGVLSSNPQRNYLMTRIKGVTQKQLATMLSRHTTMARRTNRAPAAAQLRATLPIPGGAGYR